MVFVPVHMAAAGAGQKDDKPAEASTQNAHLVVTVLSLLLLFTGVALLLIA